MDPFRRVTTGEKVRVPARTWNAILDTVESVQRPYALGQDDPNLKREPAGILLAKNTTADAIDRFRVVGFSGPSIDGDKPQFLDRMAVDAREPTADDLEIFGVTQEVILPGTFGRVLVAGLTYLRVSVQDDAHRFAEVEAASLVAKSAESGPLQLIAVPSGGTPPEERWVIARIGGGAGTGSDVCESLVDWTGYDATKTQVLGHVNGVCQLITVTECSP